VKDVNENKRKAEHHIKMLEIQKNLIFKGPEIKLFSCPTRLLLNEGLFKLVFNKESFKGCLFLFSDMLLVCKTRPKGKWLYHSSMPMENCLVLDGTGVGSGVNSPRKKKGAEHALIFSVVSPSTDDHLIVYPRSIEDKQQWMADIKKCLIKIPNSPGPELLTKESDSALLRRHKSLVRFTLS